MGERINVGLIAWAATDAMGSVSTAIDGAVALQRARTRLARAHADRLATEREIRRVDARIARIDLMEALGL